MKLNDLIKQIKLKKSYLCVGIDPDFDKIPEHIKNEEDPLYFFSKAIIDSTIEFSVAIKFNIAFFEVYGVKGISSLERLINYVNKKYPKVFTIADAKRGDIGNSSDRYAKAYFDKFPNIWKHGDYISIYEDGSVEIFGRSDTTLNPGGVRIGTAEIYRIVEAFDDVIEALVIGQTIADDVRVILFVRLADDRTLDDELQAEIKADLRIKASPRHVPAVICAVPDIPRTRSGKISELAVRDIVHGRDVKNTEALANPDALVHFRDRPELAG